MFDHLEKYLGTVQTGWKFSLSEEVKFQVVMLQSPEYDDLNFFSTLGLSEFPLPRDDSRSIRMEFLIAVPRYLGIGNAPGLLADVAREVMGRGHALELGEVIGPRGPLFKEGVMTAFMACPPFFLPDDFASARIGIGNAMVAFLIPIGNQEAAYVKNWGWSQFEDLMAEKDVNLFDIERDEVV